MTYKYWLGFWLRTKAGCQSSRQTCFDVRFEPFAKNLRHNGSSTGPIPGCLTFQILTCYVIFSPLSPVFRPPDCPLSTIFRFPWVLLNSGYFSSIVGHCNSRKNNIASNAIPVASLSIARQRNSVVPNIVSKCRSLHT